MSGSWPASARAAVGGPYWTSNTGGTRRVISPKRRKRWRGDRYLQLQLRHGGASQRDQEERWGQRDIRLRRQRQPAKRYASRRGRSLGATTTGIASHNMAPPRTRTPPKGPAHQDQSGPDDRLHVRCPRQSACCLAFPTGPRWLIFVDGQSRRIAKKLNGTTVQGFCTRTNWLRSLSSMGATMSWAASSTGAERMCRTT